METIKVIDLLNKIAYGEEVPKKIFILNTTYIWDAGLKTYKIYEPVYGDIEFGELYTHDLLNLKVEIIEDTPKEDKKIEKLGAFNIKKFYDDYPETAQFILEMFKKQEELIDRVNGE